MVSTMAVLLALTICVAVMGGQASGFHISPSYIPPDVASSETYAHVLAVLSINGLANR